MRVSVAALSALLFISCCQVARSQQIEPIGQGNPARRAAIEKTVRTLMDGGRKPVHVATPKEYESEKKILAALSEKTSVKFVGTPLVDAMAVISQRHKIQIKVDGRALEEIGLSTDTPVTLSLENVTLRSALRLLLRDVDLTYLIKDEVMQITTVEAAEQNLILEMYALPDKLAPQSDNIIAAMQKAVVPDTWETLGGPSMAVPVGHVLIVSTTSDVHDQIHEFLGKLFAAYGK